MSSKDKSFSIFANTVKDDNELTFSCRILFAELASLSMKEGYCFAGNSYFANKFEVSISSVSKWIHQLEKKNYIFIEYMRNGRQIKNRKIYINTDLCDGYSYLKKIDNPSKLTHIKLPELEATLPADAKDNNNFSKNKTMQKRYGTYGIRGNVFLTDEEFSDIIAEMGFKNAKKYINSLSYYISSTNRKYKSHSDTVISWYRKENPDKRKDEELIVVVEGNELVYE